jgi:hypothetical protein
MGTELLRPMEKKRGQIYFPVTIAEFTTRVVAGNSIAVTGNCQLSVRDLPDHDIHHRPVVHWQSFSLLRAS